MAYTAAELVFIPAPGVGHIMSIIEMAKILMNRDQRLSVTVLLINPPYPNFAHTAYMESLTKTLVERLRFIEIPQHQTLPKFDPKAFMKFMYEFINSHCEYVRNIVADMIMTIKQSGGSSRLVGFIVDMLCASMIDVANEFNLPAYVFYTYNSAFLGFNVYMENEYVDQNRDLIELSYNSEGEIAFPCFINPLPMRIVRAMYHIDERLEFLVHSFHNLRKAKGIMVNTFLELETHAIKSFPDTNFPPVYPVGPVLNLHRVAGKAEDMDVLSWLDDQPPLSVVVLCFGSMGSFNEVQVKAIACGLEQSGHRFVWSLRVPPPLNKSSEVVSDDPRLLLPDGFLERTMETGKVIGWAPQVALLAHEAVGGFVSHCGWNSMLESLWFGVPTAAWPMHSEQQFNAFEMVVELGLSVDLKLDYKIDLFNPDANTVTVMVEEIEMGIRRLMENNEVRKKVKEMSKLSRVTVAQGGSSYASVSHIVQEIMSNII